MKKLIIGLFACLCFTSCITVTEKDNTLIVIGSTSTVVRKGVTTYKIGVYDSNSSYDNIIRYRTKLGTFEIGDTVVIVKK
jgi:hypothetical protein